MIVCIYIHTYILYMHCKERHRELLAVRRLWKNVLAT